MVTPGFSTAWGLVPQNPVLFKANCTITSLLASNDTHLFCNSEVRSWELTPLAEITCQQGCRGESVSSPSPASNAVFLHFFASPSSKPAADHLASLVTLHFLSNLPLPPSYKNISDCIKGHLNPGSQLHFKTFDLIIPAESPWPYKVTLAGCWDWGVDIFGGHYSASHIHLLSEESK